MLVLLPPSETKRVTLDAKAAAAADTITRCAAGSAVADPPPEILAALQQLSKKADERAHRALKLKPGNKAAEAFAANLNIEQSVKIPAVLRYTGVLYDALDAAGMQQQELNWLAQNVAVQSALYGITRANSTIANYRLSANSSLPGLGESLKNFWQQKHRNRNWDSAGFVLDLRSNEYAALAPLAYGDKALKLHIAQRDQNGELKALNHFNKQAKGYLVKKMAESAADINTVADFCNWAATQGIELQRNKAANQVSVTMITELGAPIRR